MMKHQKLTAANALIAAKYSALKNMRKLSMVMNSDYHRDRAAVYFFIGLVGLVIYLT